MLLLLLLLLLATLAALPLILAKQLGGMSTTFCAIQPDGQVYCFGNNEAGQLGGAKAVANLTYSQFPVKLLGVDSASDLAFGVYHGCILDWGNVVKCVGANDEGALGVSSVKVQSTRLVTISALSSAVVQVYASYQRSCALLQNRAVMCWGKNQYGALGDGTSTTRFTPTFVSGFSASRSSSKAVDLSMGYTHTCLLTTLGAIKCVGSNSDGQLGDGTQKSSRTPVQVKNFPSSAGKMAAVAAGGWHTCSVDTKGRVFAWGYDMYGQLGQGAIIGMSLVPVTPVGLTGTSSRVDVSAVYAGRVSTFARLKYNGTVLAWGDNELGGLGSGDTQTKFKPTAFWGGKSGIQEVRGGFAGTCVLDQLSQVYCVGSNDENLEGGVREDRFGASALAVVRIPGFVDKPVRKEYAKCKPTWGLDKPACERLGVACRKESKILMAWTGRGCKLSNGKWANDAGCRCDGYCGFTCKSACTAAKKTCKWSSGRCVSKKTGLPDASKFFAHCPMTTV